MVAGGTPLGAGEDSSVVLGVDSDELSVVASVVAAVDSVVTVVGSATVCGSSSDLSRKYSATPIAARTTTPATISAISVFFCPFGGGAPGAHCCPGWPGWPYAACC